MSENRTMLVDTAVSVFAEAKTRGFGPLQDAGFPSLLISETKGGFGGDWGDLFAILRVAGGLPLLLPIGETIIAAKLQSDLGHTVSVEPQSLDDISLGAFVRVGLAAGAMDAILAMSVEHANTRVQFGKPLGKFQAVQQSLAVLAVEAAAVNVAGAACAAALDKYGSDGAMFEIAAAKLRTNQAIATGTAIAHQVHGAIGFTQDYALHPVTTSLMAWRSDCGNEAYWSTILGGLACANGGEGLWAEIARRGDRN